MHGWASFFPSFLTRSGLNGLCDLVPWLGYTRRILKFYWDTNINIFNMTIEEITETTTTGEMILYSVVI